MALPWQVPIPNTNIYLMVKRSCHAADIVIGCAHPTPPHPHPTKKLFWMEMDSLVNSKTFLWQCHGTNSQQIKTYEQIFDWQVA